METNEPTSSGNKSNRTLWIALAVAAAVVLCICLVIGVAAGIFLLARSEQGNAPYVPPVIQVEAPTFVVTEAPAPVFMEPQQVDYANADDNTLGDPDARLTLTIYSDLQCPFCRRFHQQTVPQIIRAYVDTGQVRLVYRSMGDFLGPESALGAQAAYCAGDQDAFWPFLDYVFANQSGENTGLFTVGFMTQIADELGLDTDAFEACVESGKYYDRVMQDFNDGVNAGVNGTPTTVFSNGTLIEGSQPFETFMQQIDAALGN